MADQSFQVLDPFLVFLDRLRPTQDFHDDLNRGVYRLPFFSDTI
jgi:hypothetical protein